MTGDEGARGIAGKFGKQLAKSDEGFGAVSNENGEAEFGIEPVIGDADDDASARQRLAYNAVFALASGNEAAAVEEQHGRRGRLEAVGHIEVEFMAFLIAVRNVALDAIARARHGQIEQRCRRAAAAEKAEYSG